MKKVVFVLSGADFTNCNLGCQALSYSLISILARLDEIEAYFKVFVDYEDTNKTLQMCKAIGVNEERVQCIKWGIRNHNVRKRMLDTLKSCDVVIDMNGGDSFTDLYGVKRFFVAAYLKKVAINNKKILIFGPQTYGPFKKRITKQVAKYLLNNAELIASRDLASEKIIRNYTNKKVVITTDIAVTLPYVKNRNFNSKNIHVGFNISGLLWNGGYTGKNQFALKTDYCMFVKQIIEYFSSLENVKIHLIGHVNNNVLNSVEDDYRICKRLSDEYKIICAPFFKDPVEAKNYISKLDFFMGSRMHATIGAFSSGVTTLPIAYSDKFERMFGSLGYNHILDLRDKELEEACEYVKILWDNRDSIYSEQLKAMDEMDGKILKFEEEMLKLLL